MEPIKPDNKNNDIGGSKGKGKHDKDKSNNYNRFNNSGFSKD